MQQDEKLKELLSAVLDGELEDVSEFEIHQLLKAAEGDDEFHHTLYRYAVVSSVMNNEPVCGPEHDSLSFLNSVRAGIDDVKLEKSKTGMFAWAGKTAIAASVCLAVIFGSRLMEVAPVVQPQLVQDANVSSQEGRLDIAHTSATSRVLPGNMLAVSEGHLTTPSDNMIPQVTASQLQEIRQQRMRRYLMYHLEHASLNNNNGMLPFARVSNLEE